MGYTIDPSIMGIDHSLAEYVATPANLQSMWAALGRPVPRLRRRRRPRLRATHRHALARGVSMRTAYDPELVKVLQLVQACPESVRTR
jgi:hypothetical protein